MPSGDRPLPPRALQQGLQDGPQGSGWQYYINQGRLEHLEPSISEKSAENDHKGMLLSIHGCELIVTLDFRKKG